MRHRLRGAVVGVGYLGRFHAEKMAALPDVDLVAVVDIDRPRAEAVAAQAGATPFTDYRRILTDVDLVTIAVPTSSHYPIARDFLLAGCHVLLEKPITPSVAEADTLIALAAASGCILQVGHLERFNPAIVALQGMVRSPRVLFTHRLAPYRLRGTDVSVVLDLMIHDIDIVLQNVSSPVSRVNSVGAVGPSGNIDIANARLHFEDGCVANLTASRVSTGAMRRIQVFGADNVATVDCQARRIDVLCAAESGEQPARIGQSFPEGDPLQAEIAAFVHAARAHRQPLVSGHDGRRALAIALEIEAAVRSADIREAASA